MMEEIIKAIKQTKTEIGNKEIECEWKEFLFSEIFDDNIKSGNERQNRKPKGIYPLIGTGTQNNGVVEYIESDFIFPANGITISNIDRKAIFYQKTCFCATQNVFVLKPLFNINENIAMYFLVLLKHNYDKTDCGWGNYIGIEGIKKFTFTLPTKNNQPDFEMMEKIIVDLKNRMKIWAITERERE